MGRFPVPGAPVIGVAMFIFSLPAASQTVVGQITSPALQPTDVAVYEAGNQILVADQASGNLLRYDATTLTELGSIPLGLGSFVSEMVVDESLGKVYAAGDWDEPRIVVADLVAGTFVRHLSLAPPPSTWALLAGDDPLDKVYVLWVGGFAQIDVATDAVTLVPGVTGNPNRYMSVNPVSHEVLITDWAVDRLQIVDGTTRAVTSIPGLKGLDAEADTVTNQVYVLWGEPTLPQTFWARLLDRGSGNITPLPPWGSPFQAHFNPVSRTLFTDAGQDGLAHLLDTKTGTLLRLPFDGYSDSTDSFAVRHATDHAYYAQMGKVLFLDGTSALVEEIPVPFGSGGAIVFSDVAIAQASGRVAALTHGSGTHGVTVLQDTPVPRRPPIFVAGPNNQYDVLRIDSGSKEAVTTYHPIARPGRQLALAGGGARLYVPAWGTPLVPTRNVVEVFEGTGPAAKVAELPSGGQEPTAAALSPAGDVVWVVNATSGTVTAVDSRSGSLLHTEPVSGSPNLLATNPRDGTLLVTRKATGELGFLDPTSRTLVASLPICAEPWAIAVHPSGTRAWVACAGSGSVATVDLMSRSLLRTTPVGTAPHGIACTPDGRRVLVANGGTGSLSVLDAETDAVLSTVPLTGTGPSGSRLEGVAVHPGGSEAYVVWSATSGAGTLFTVALPGLTVTTSAIGTMHAAVAVAEPTGRIAGLVTLSGPPAAGITVGAYQAGAVVAATTSDAQGTYSLFDLPPGTYELRAACPCCSPFASPGRAVQAGRVEVVDVSLAPTCCTVACSASVPASGAVAAPVAFAAAATASGCAGEVSFAWTFGDGATSGEASPLHTYTATGSFPWTLTVSAGGQTCARNGVIAIVTASELSPAAGSTATHFVPIVLSSAGVPPSFYTSEMTLTNRGTATATLELSYTQAFGGGTGTGTDSLGPGQQKVIPDAIAYLRSLGIPIPDTGNRGGTLHVRFQGLANPSDGSVTVRTTSPVPQGRAGLAYSSIDVLGLPRPVPVPSSGTVRTGSFRATNYGTADAFPAPAPTPAGDASLGRFEGVSPNGSWRLFVVDDISGDSGSLSEGWCLELKTTAQSFQACNAARIQVPETGSGVTTGAPASPYPSTIEVQGVSGTVTHAAVVLKGLTHPFLSDVDMLLEGPGGRQATIFSDAGSSASSASVRLDDALTQVLLGGLRQNTQDRSNVAIMNGGTAAEGDIVVRVTVVSGDPAAPAQKTLADETLPPGAFKQFSGILSELGDSVTHGWVRVEKVAGTAPLYAYAVVNDQGTSDGSFVTPVLAAEGTGTTAQTLPVVVESGVFASELVLTNTTSASKTISFELVAENITASGNRVTFSISPKAGEQIVIPNLVQYLRDQKVSGVPAAGTSVAGALFASVSSGDFQGILIGARTWAPGDGGRYGLFYPAVASSLALSGKGWIHGLVQDAMNRTNLALVNTSTSSTDVFTIDFFDGSTGTLAGSLTNVSVPPKRWLQIGTVLSQAAPGVSQAYARITRSSGTGSYFAYGVLNDGAGPGERSGDGAFVWAVPDCVFTVPASRTFGWSGGSTSFDVSAAKGCYWSAESPTSWIALSGATVGNGNGTVSYSLPENSTSSSRSGSVEAAGRVFSVTQLGNSPGPYDGSWIGETGQNRPVSFQITRNEVTSLTLGLSASLGQCSISGTFTAERLAPRTPVISSGFSLGVLATGSGGDAPVSVTGTFGSTAAASGAWSISFIIAGRSMCLGFPGPGSTWTATRQ